MNVDDQQDARLAEALRRLGEDGLEPPRDLWPAIREELAAARPVRRRPMWLLLAASLALLASSVATTLWLNRDSSPQGLGGLAAERAPTDLPSAISPELRRAFDDYLDERQRLLDRVARELGGYPPEVRRDILASIEVIEDSMREIEASLGRLPSQGSEQRLAALYGRELRLLRAVGARLGGSVNTGGFTP